MLLNEIISLRGVLHEIPERSGQEQQTIQTLLNFLNRCTTLELHPRDGWFYALHREPGAERTIAVRGDMDAIENSGGTLFHGCGHDGHSAILAGLGAALDAGAAETVVSVAKAELVSRENAMANANSSAPIRVCLFIV